MKEKRGTHLDPEILDIFLDQLDEFLRIDEKIASTDSESKSSRSN